MHAYVSAFTDRITGITGNTEELAKVIKSWRVYAARVPDEDGSYTMDHTASVFLLNSEGRFSGTISYGEDMEVALTKLRNLMKE
jgi:protein SCO1/2